MKGRGFEALFSYDTNGLCSGVSSHACDQCNGSGEVQVDMTWQDHIQTMTATELAVFLYGVAHNNSRPRNVEEVQRFLAQKAHEGRTSIRG